MSKSLSYLNLRRQLRKNNPIQNTLLLIPFLLIIILFIFNTLMNESEQLFKDEKYELREKDATWRNTEIASGNWDATPTIKKN